MKRAPIVIFLRPNHGASSERMVAGAVSQRGQRPVRGAEHGARSRSMNMKSVRIAGKKWRPASAVRTPGND
jgi:hypothetical protein